MQLPTPEDVIAAIDAFIERHGMSPTRFGADATGDPNLIAALKGGSSPSLKRLHRIAAFMNDRDRLSNAPAIASTCDDREAA